MAKKKIRVAVKPVPEVITKEAILEIIEDPKLKYETKALIAILYLTGGRISEVLAVRPMDIVKAADNVITFKLINSKNRRTKRKVIPIILLNDVERKMMKYIFDFYTAKNTPADARIFTFTRHNAWRRLQKINEIIVRASDYKNKVEIDDMEFKLHPHYFRHCRATHLANDYNLSAIDIQNAMGWSDTRPLSIYAHGDWRTMAQKMLNCYSSGKHEQILA